MRQRNALVAASIAGLVAGSCRDLPARPAGTCGNAVVDDGEDCDTVEPPGFACGEPTAGAEACRWTCDPGGAGAADAPGCPAGWVCAAAGVCTRATGRYREAAAGQVDWRVAEWDLVDLDGDGVLDVLGAVPGELRALLGRGNGGFSTEIARGLPARAEPRPVAGDIDGDGRREVVVPSPAGLLVFRVGAEGRFETVPTTPYAVPAPDGAWAVPFRSAGMPPSESEAQQMLMVLTEAEENITALFFDPDGTTIPYRERMHSIEGELDRLGRRLPVADLDHDDDEEVVLAFEGRPSISVASTGPDPRFTDQYRFASEWWTGELLGESVIGPPRDARRDSPNALLADADGDGRLDLFVQVADVPASAVRWPGAEDGLFGEPEPETRFDDLGFPLAAGDIDGDGLADFVTPGGLLLSQEDVEAPAPWPDEWWSDAVLVDLDGDRAPEAVAIADKLKPSLHLHQRMGPGLWNATEVAVDDPARNLRVGHFDCDWREDLAFASGDGVLGILLASTREPIVVARVPGLERFEPGRLRDSTGYLGATTDIVATTTGDADGYRWAAAFTSSCTSVLDSPFILQEYLDATAPRVAIVAHVDRDDAPLASDVLAVVTEDEDLWVVRGASDHLLRASDARRVDSSRLGAAELLGATDCALWTAGDVDGDGSDEVVFAGPLCDDGQRVTLVEIDLEDETLEALGVLGVPSDLALADLDADGPADLLVTYGGGADVVWSRDGRLDPASATALPDLGGGQPVTAVAAIQADDDPARELAVAAAGGLYLLELDPSGVARVSPEPFATLEATRLGAADVDRDGLEDLVVGEGDHLTVLLAVRHVELGP